MNSVIRFVRDERGQDLIEYALLGFAVSLAALAGMNLLGSALNAKYDALATTVNSVP